MVRLRFLAPLGFALALSSCSFLLDFDELQKGEGGKEILGSGGSGGAGGSGGGGSTGVPLEDAAGVVASAVCEKFDTCVGQAALRVVLHDEDCLTLVTRLIDNSIIATIEEKGVEYDPLTVPTCVDALSALDCEEISLDFPQECRQLLGELTPEGGECLRSLECEPGLYCSTGTCPGTCSPLLPADSPCAEGDVCTGGYTCFEGTCQPLGREGDDCGGTVLPDCLTGLVCAGADDAMMEPGKCRPASSLFVSGEDQVCKVGNPATLCQEELSCPILTLTPACVPRAPSLGACELALPDMCPEGEYCNAGTCAPLPGAGQPCAFGLILKPTCQAYMRCIDGTCRRLGEIGNTCVVDAECYSGTCFDGTCVAPRCH